MLSKKGVLGEMADVIRDLHRDHANIALLLDMLEDHVRVFEEGGVPDFDLLMHIVDYFRDYPDSVHHPKEDLVLERLRARDPLAADAVGDLAAEHEEIGASTQRFAAALETVLQDAEMPRETFPRAVDDFVTRLREHMNKEDTLFMPAAERTLTAQDWEDVARAFNEREDPLFSERAEKRFDALRDYLFG